MGFGWLLTVLINFWIGGIQQLRSKLIKSVLNFLLSVHIEIMILGSKII
jgi:hypothetical protein